MNFCCSFGRFEGGIWERRCAKIEIKRSLQVDQNIIFRCRENPKLKRVSSVHPREIAKN